MLGKLSSSLTALGKHRTTNKEDRGIGQQLQRLSCFKLAGLAQLSSMYQSLWLGSVQQAAWAGSSLWSCCNTSLVITTICTSSLRSPTAAC